jgi:hypothetical protein
MHFDDLLRRVSRLLVQAVDVLRDQRVQSSRAFKISQRAMAGVRLSLPRRMIQALLPRKLAHLGI